MQDTVGVLECKRGSSAGKMQELRRNAETELASSPSNHKLATISWSTISNFLSNFHSLCPPDASPVSRQFQSERLNNLQTILCKKMIKWTSTCTLNKYIHVHTHTHTHILQTDTCSMDESDININFDKLCYYMCIR